MMTGLLSEEAFSRKTFVKGGGALVVTVVAASAAGKASAANGLTPFTARGPADYLPDLTQIDTWITITPDNKCIVTHGETELGHGTPTGILMLTADELNMTMDQMTYAHPETWLNATGGGAGSGGISSRSTNIRAAEYATVNPDFSSGGDKVDVSKGNTNPFNNGFLLTGSGEPPTAAIAGAIANAFFDATGVRIRQSPMNSANVRAAFKLASGTAK